MDLYKMYPSPPQFIKQGNFKGMFTPEDQVELFWEYAMYNVKYSNIMDFFLTHMAFLSNQMEKIHVS